MALGPDCSDSCKPKCRLITGNQPDLFEYNIIVPTNHLGGKKSVLNPLSEVCSHLVRQVQAQTQTVNNGKRQQSRKMFNHCPRQRGEMRSLTKKSCTKRKELDWAREKTRINIGASFQRWRELQAQHSAWYTLPGQKNKIITAWAIIFQLATSYLTPTDAMSSFLFFKQLCWKTHLVVVGLRLNHWHALRSRTSKEIA